MNALLMKWLALGMVALVMCGALGLAHSIQDRKPILRKGFALLGTKTVLASVVSVGMAASSPLGD